MPFTFRQFLAHHLKEENERDPLPLPRPISVAGLVLIDDTIAQTDYTSPTYAQKAKHKNSHEPTKPKRFFFSKKFDSIEENTAID